MKAMLITILIAAFPFIGLHAADDNIDLDEPTATTAEAVAISTEENDISVDENSNETIGESSTEPSDENFVPSIRITEDLPVAFPVDI